MSFETMFRPIVQTMQTTGPTRKLLRAFRQWHHPRDGSRPRVLCVGYLKTGTTSFAHAMRRLGFSHYGYDRDLLRALERGDVDRCLRVAERFDGLDDRPWSHPMFVDAFRRRFPGSYFVLLEREEDQWLRSYQSFSKRQEPAQDSLKRLRDHNTTILELLADEPHLLRMNICAGDGYQKICSFLGLQDPGLPFPWANSAEP